MRPRDEQFVITVTTRSAMPNGSAPVAAQLPLEARACPINGDAAVRSPTRFDKLLFSPAETCDILSIKKTTLYKWLNLGILRSRRIGGKRLIEAESVRELSAGCSAAKPGVEG